MKIFQNKRMFKKILIVLILIILFSFCMPKNVRADDGIGGKLLNPIMSFLVSIGDGVMSLLQKVVFDIDDSLIQVGSAGFWSKVLVIFAAFVTVSVIIAATVLSAGAAGLTVAGIAAALKGTAAVLVTIGFTTISFPVTTQIVEGMLPDNFQLPMFSITPQEIFSNKISILDVDFFNPSPDTTQTKLVEKKVKTIDTWLDTLAKDYGFPGIENCEDFWVEVEGDTYKDPGKYNFYSWDYNGKSYRLIKYENVKRKNAPDDIGWACGIVEEEVWTDGNKAFFEGDYLFGGDGDTWILDSDYETITESEEVTNESIAKQLRGVVSNWYNILRDIALVALLSILVYVGIRIIISSTSQDKAKYKQLLVDWIVAICLLFVMQYIMSFSNIIVKKIIEVVDTTHVATDEEDKSEITEPEVFLITDKDKITQAYNTLIKEGEEDSNPYYNFFVDDQGNPAGKNATVLLWPTENFMQQARLQLQLLDDNKDTYVAIGWKLIYIVLVLYTIIFIFTYVKRVVYMAFLTIISPLVALTYPIDKMNDGSAQAFNMWLKEYIFNLLIQPMHLILYTILIGSAMEFASKNIIYVVVALGFMVPAEKLLRRFFGFEKAHTPGLLAGPAGAAMTMEMVKRLTGRPPMGHRENRAGGKLASGGKDEKSSIKYKDNLSNSDSLLYGLGNGHDNENKGDAELDKLKKQRDNLSSLNERDKKNGLDIGKDKIAQNRQRQIDNLNKKIGSMETKQNPSGNLPKNTGKRKIKNAVGNVVGRVKKSSIGRAGRALKSGGRYYAKGMANKLTERAKNAHPMRTAIRTAGGLAAGATLGTVGLVAGITSGDPSKAVQYTSVAALGGYKMGKGVTDTAVDAISVDGIGEEMQKEYYGEEEYKEKQIQKNIKKVQKDDAIREELEVRLEDKNRAREAMETIAPECVRYGLTEANEIAAVTNRVADGKSIDESIAIVNEAKSFGKRTSKMGRKDRDDFVNTVNDRIRKNNRGLTKTQEEVLQRDILKNIDAAGDDLYKKI